MLIKARAFDGKTVRYDVTGFGHGDKNEMVGVFLDGDYYLIVDDIADDHDQFNPVAVVDLFSGLQDSRGEDIYENDIVMLSGYGEYTAEFPFIELYEAAAENDIGEIIGNKHTVRTVVEG